MAGTGSQRRTPTLIVKFKSANVDEFVAQHGHNVSRQGIFLKARKPPQLGLAVRFEIRLADDSPALAGTGRVAWRRDADGDPALPAGIGVAFDALEGKSSEVVERIVRERGGRMSAFDQDAHAERAETRVPDAGPATVPAPPPTDVEVTAPAPAPPAETTPAPEPPKPAHAAVQKAPAVSVSSPELPRASAEAIPALGQATATTPRVPSLGTARTVTLGAAEPRSSVQVARVSAVGDAPSSAVASAPLASEAQAHHDDQTDIPAFQDIDVEEAEVSHVSVPPSQDDEDDDEPTVPLSIERLARARADAPLPATSAASPHGAAPTPQAHVVRTHDAPPTPAAHDGAPRGPAAARPVAAAAQPRAPVAARPVAAATRPIPAAPARAPGGATRVVAIVIGLASIAGAGWFGWQGMLARRRAAAPQDVVVSVTQSPAAGEPEVPVPSEPGAALPPAAAAPADAGLPDAGLDAGEDAIAVEDAPPAAKAEAEAKSNEDEARSDDNEPPAPSAEARTAADTPAPATPRKRKRPRTPRTDWFKMAQECLAAGDNACVIKTLAGRARTARELALLIETYRATGDGENAKTAMRQYLERFPDEARAADYRLALGIAE